MKDYAEYSPNGDLYWADEVENLTPYFSESTLALIEKINAKHDADIGTRVKQQLFEYDEEIDVNLAGDDHEMVNVNEFLQLILDFIAIGDELPLDLLGDYLWMTPELDRKKLKEALQEAKQYHDKYYDDIEDSSTHFFTHTLNVAYKIWVG